jgi:hypothetical protein
MAPFSSFVDLLTEIEDPRRAEGKLYRLPHVVLFAILAMVAGANSYRTIHSFIDVHIARLREAFGVKWRKAQLTRRSVASCDNSIPPRSKLRFAAMPPC